MPSKRKHYWNYRVRRFNDFVDIPDMEPEEAFDIIEIYYDGNDKPIAWGGVLGPLGSTEEELRKDLEHMLAAFDKPTLHEDELPGAKIDE